MVAGWTPGVACRSSRKVFHATTGLPPGAAAVAWCEAGTAGAALPTAGATAPRAVRPRADIIRVNRRRTPYSFASYLLTPVILRLVVVTVKRLERDRSGRPS